MRRSWERREFLAAAAGGLEAAFGRWVRAGISGRRPNLVFVFADQWRAQASGYAGDPNARTPNLDRFSRQSVNFTNAVSVCPVCSPYRASLMTGRYPLTHGIFMNDVCLGTEAVSLAQAFSRAGYDTAYIGKWHLDGHGRSQFIPRERRQGFRFWRALECTHDYNNSAYYADRNIKLRWDGYDAIAQTREAQRYLREHASRKPFLLVLSWGPPHDPYQTAPGKYRALFQPERMLLRPNVPADSRKQAQIDLAGYYAHIAALDECVGILLATLEECGMERDTIVAVTSDHGDMLHSHGSLNKQQPLDESVRVPLLVRYPAALGARNQTLDVPINTPDLMPTLLGLCGIRIPGTVEGTDFSSRMRGLGNADAEAALLMCAQPFGQWSRARGGREYRGVRTRTHTFIRDLTGPWLLFDNENDPFQIRNLCDAREYSALQRHLDQLLTEKLKQTRDEFLPGPRYLERWNYRVDETGTVPYAP